METKSTVQARAIEIKAHVVRTAKGEERYKKPVGTILGGKKVEANTMKELHKVGHATDGKNVHIVPNPNKGGEGSYHIHKADDINPNTPSALQHLGNIDKDGNITYNNEHAKMLKTHVNDALDKLASGIKPAKKKDDLKVSKTIDAGTMNNLHNETDGGYSYSNGNLDVSKDEDGTHQITNIMNTSKPDYVGAISPSGKLVFSDADQEKHFAPHVQDLLDELHPDNYNNAKNNAQGSTEDKLKAIIDASPKTSMGITKPTQDKDPNWKPNHEGDIAQWSSVSGKHKVTLNASKSGYSYHDADNSSMGSLGKVSEDDAMAHMHSRVLAGLHQPDANKKPMVFEDLRHKGKKSFGENIEYKTHYSNSARSKMAKDGHALKDGSFPIKNETDLHNAVGSYDRASDPTSAKELIVRRAKELDCVNALPDSWCLDDPDLLKAKDSGKAETLPTPALATMAKELPMTVVEFKSLQDDLASLRVAMQ